jgi:hypothetical protein
MATVAEASEGAVAAASQPTRAFGPVESADETRQAQQSVSNDAPTDVNFNAIIARSQAHTVDVLGKQHSDNQDIRAKIAGAAMGEMISGFSTKKP